MKRHIPALLALAVFAAGCGSHETGKAEDLRPPVQATAIIPESGSSRAVLTLAGRIKAAEEVTIASRIASRVTAMRFREGQPFRKGQTLVAFDAPEMRQALASAEANLEATLTARDKTRLQEARVDSLRKTGVASDRQLELAVIDRQAAEAAHAQVASALSTLRESISLTVPFDGVVVRLHVDAGAPVSPGQPVLDVRSNAVGEIEVPFPESELDRLNRDRIQFQVGDSVWRDATVLRVDGMTDFASRTRIAHLTPLSADDLEPGAFARIRVMPVEGDTTTTMTTAGLSIPVESLVRRGALNGVFLFRDGRARLRWLRTGREEGGRVQILAGLDAGERIAARPDGLEDGRAVTVTP